MDALCRCGAAGEEAMTPFERTVSTPRGQLKSPYTDFASAAEEGHKIYLKHGGVEAWRLP